MDVKFIDFQNICRTCLSTSDLINIQGNYIIDILQFLSSSNYKKTDELPQKLCVNCIGIMSDIQTFAFKCQQTHLTLSNCLSNFKNNQLYKQPPEETNNLVTEQLVKKEIEFQEIIVKDEIINEETNQDNQIEQKKRIDKPPHQCDICNHTFKTKSNLTNHKKIHGDKRRFKCNECLKCFQNSGHLIEHKRIHSGERPYQCDTCYKAFSIKSNLVTHKATHSDERPFVCDVCRKGFKISSALARHKRQMHVT